MHASNNNKKFLVMIATFAVALMAFAIISMAAVATEASAAQKQCNNAHKQLRGAGLKNGLSLKQYRRAFYCVVNAERKASGLAPYTVSDKTEKAAQCHAQFMVSQNKFSHTEPAPAPCGKYPEDRLTTVGWDFSLLPEGAGPIEGITNASTPFNAIQAFLASPGHCRGILYSTGDMMGVGAAKSRKSSMVVLNAIGDYNTSDATVPPCPRKMRTNAAPFVRIMWAKRKGKRLVIRLRTNVKRRVRVVTNQRSRSGRLLTKRFRVRLNGKPRTVRTRLPLAGGGEVNIMPSGYKLFR